MSDYIELKRLAEDATPGRWTAYDTHGRRFIEAIGTEDHVVCATPKKQWLKDSEYIAAANPAAVMALIAEVESLREHKQLLVDLREADGYESWASVLVMVDKLKADNEALRKDAERYRFIRRSGGLIWTVIESQKKATGDLYDVGVDAAMSKGEQP